MSLPELNGLYLHPLQVLKGPVDDLVGGGVPSDPVVAGLDSQEVVVSVVHEEMVEELVEGPGGCGGSLPRRVSRRRVHSASTLLTAF